MIILCAAFGGAGWLEADVAPAQKPDVPDTVRTPFGTFQCGLPKKDNQTPLPKAFHRSDVGLHPGLAEAALRLHFENPYILWALLRTYDASKSGSIHLASFMAYVYGQENAAGFALRPVMTKSVLYRSLAVGESIGLFRITRSAKGTNVYPCRLDRAVVILGASHLGQVQLVRPAVLTSFAGRRAWLLAVAIGKPFDGLEGKGASTRKARMNGWAKPRSRASIQVATGVSVRTQRRLNHKAGVHRVSHQQAIESPSKEGVYIPTSRQLPNSYLSRGTPGTAGRPKSETRSALSEQRINAGVPQAFGLQALVEAQSQNALQGPSGRSEVSQQGQQAQRASLDLRKRYFWDATSFVRTKSNKRNTDAVVLLWNGSRPQRIGRRYLWS